MQALQKDTAFASNSNYLSYSPPTFESSAIAPTASASTTTTQEDCTTAHLNTTPPRNSNDTKIEAASTEFADVEDTPSRTKRQIEPNMPPSKRLQVDPYGSDDAQPPSRVLLFRNLSPAVTEYDLEHLLSPLSGGSTPKIYLEASWSHAFVEFKNEQIATSTLNFFKAHPTQLKGLVVQPVYSRRDEVTMDDKPDCARVLHVSVSNIVYPVDIELINFLFSKYGCVEKIVTFSKSPSMYQALVQFADGAEAKSAMKALNSRNIYDGCNSIQIQPSRNSELTVKANSAKSWDFTIPAATPTQQQLHSFSALGGISAVAASQVDPPSILPTPQCRGMVPQMMPPMSGGSTPPHMRGGYAAYGMNDAVNAHAAAGGMPASYHQMPQMHPMQGDMSGAMYRGTSHIHVPYEKLPREMKDMNLETENPNQTPVIIVYNLSSTDITVTKLFNLFSLYGSVLRVKILREKPDTALIQFSDPLYATMSYNLLQGAPVFQRDVGVQICYSKNKEVKLPPQRSTDTTYEITRTRAFQMNEQRYGGHPEDVDKYLRGACRPTTTLFVANINEEVTEEELKELLQQYGTVKSCELRPPKEGSRKRMAFFEMDSDAEAIAALCNLHNYRLRDANIKIAFSKSHIMNAERPANWR